METENELNAKIMAKTLEIQEKHPELFEFLNEMPITIPDVNKPEINIKILSDYYNSLCNVLKEHIIKTNTNENK